MRELGNLIKDILAELILLPKRLGVTVDQAGSLYKIRIICDASDARRVIGAKGTHFRAMDALCRSFDESRSIHVSLLPLDVPRVDGAGVRHNSFETNPHWPKEKLIGLIERMERAGFQNGDSIEALCIDDKNDSTVIARCSELESQRTVERMDEALSVLGNAIGKANGRTLLVRVDPTIRVTEQPSDSSGRFAKMVA